MKADLNDNSNELINEYKRMVWVIDGLVDHGHELKKLVKIYSRYKGLKLVPEHYRFPELTKINFKMTLMA